jgi:peroxiredoxin Q/BCP
MRIPTLSMTASAMTIVLMHAISSAPLAAEEKEAKEKEKVIAPPGVGDAAPLVEATDDADEKWKLADYLGEDVVVLYFYPADLTGGCTKQACGYRDDLSKLEKLGAVVVGVSGDSAANHRIFKKVHELNFTLLADEDGKVARAFGVPVSAGGTISQEIDGEKLTLTRGVTASRVTVVVGLDGRVAHIEKVRDAGGDSARVLEVVEKISKPRAAAEFNKVLRIGDAAPRWKDLVGVDDKKHSFASHADAKVLVVAVTCNGCPVAKAYEDRMIEFAKAYGKKGVAVVAINVNKGPGDRLDKMKERAVEKGFAFPYLYDPSQSIARELGATVTPHWFVFDGKRRVRFMGSFDDNMNAAEAKTRYVPDVVDALLAGKVPATSESKPVGCGIQYETK